MTTISEKIAWRAYVAGVGIVSTIVTRQLLGTAWRLATGAPPPRADDAEAPLRSVAIWAVASGVGIGVTRVLTDRLLVRHLRGSLTPAS